MALTNQQKLDEMHTKVSRYLDLKTSDVTPRVWDGSFISRGGQEITVKQELADAKTLGLENKAALVEVHKKLDAILAKLNEGA